MTPEFASDDLVQVMLRFAKSTDEQAAGVRAHSLTALGGLSSFGSKFFDAVRTEDIKELLTSASESDSSAVRTAGFELFGHVISATSKAQLKEAALELFELFKAPLEKTIDPNYGDDAKSGGDDDDEDEEEDDDEDDDDDEDGLLSRKSVRCSHFCVCVLSHNCRR